MNCPDCHSEKIVKNGSLTNGKQKYKCKDCGRQFVLNPSIQPISDQTKSLIDKLLLERVPLAGITRVTGVSERWLQNYVNEKYENIPQIVIVSKKSKGRLTIECDELWSFVGKKQNKQWLWLAIDRDSREMVGVAVGERNSQTAKELWDSLPAVYRQCAVSYTDFWDSYKKIFPSTRHQAVGFDLGKPIILNVCVCLRQRISRLVRKTLSFSKKLENHIGAIWYFIHYYNARRLFDILSPTF